MFLRTLEQPSRVWADVILVWLPISWNHNWDDIRLLPLGRDLYLGWMIISLKNKSWHFYESSTKIVFSHVLATSLKLGFWSRKWTDKNIPRCRMHLVYSWVLALYYIGILHCLSWNVPSPLGIWTVCQICWFYSTSVLGGKCHSVFLQEPSERIVWYSDRQFAITC